MTPFRRVLTGAVLFLITIIVATAGYMVAGWTFLDAIYQVVITVFGVGFGEVNPITTPTLRLFTMLVIIGGTSSAVYAVGGIVQMITEGEINRALGVRRMLKAIETLENHTIICGFGRMGQILARELKDKQKPFVIVDNDAGRVVEAQEMSYLVISGNATDEEVLELAGIRRARYLATVLPDDAANVFITLTSRGMNPALSILARGEYPSTERKLRLAGANHVVLPATICAMRMSQMITHPASLDLLNHNDGSSTLNELLGNLDMQLDELRVSRGSALIGSFVKDLEVRGRGQVGRTYLIVALRRADGTLIMNPGSTVVLHEDDTVIVMGHRGDMPKLSEELSLKRQIRYRGAKL
ncbi:TrkA family potassium uptake protein [Thermoleptolyngbya sp. PKUAC-SCTB121]|uniref:potassium channel family protein n=1 Tax=Thermoleptolyngbya sp. PKUAC-SCTB121 TaxID=2811482 RepID=UPI001965FDA2|nr:potassium channel protein [Thermoleptolyngbya sp. PKUAC-SCTB121]